MVSIKAIIMGVRMSRLKMTSRCEIGARLIQGYGRHCASRYFSFFILCGFSSFVSAGAWVVQPSITVTEMFTDNVDLTTAQETQDRITEIAPSLLLTRDGDRIQLSIDYEMQGVYYDKSAENDSSFSQVNAALDSELVDELFYTELLVTKDQQIVSPLGPVVSNNYIVTDNRTDSTAFQLSPYLRHRLTSKVAGEIRYRFNKIDYSDGAIDDSKSDEVILDIGTLGTDGGGEWRLQYLHNTIKYDSGVENVFSISSLDVVEYILPRFGLIASLGYEDNEYEVLPGQEEPKGGVWAVGFRWAPTARRNIELRTGERFFGKTYSLNMTGRERQLTWSMAYSELPMSTGQLQLEQLTSAQGQVSSLNTAVFIRKYFTTMAAIELDRGTLSLSVFKDRRDYEESSEGEVTEGALLAIELQPFSRTRLIFENNWHKQSFRAQQREDQVNESDIGLEYMISPRAMGALSVGHVKRDSTNAIFEYSSNVIVASLEYAF